MKTGFAYLVFAFAVLSAGLVFAQGNDPESYRQTLLSRALSAGESGFCQQKASGAKLADCQVSLNFLKDIIRGQNPSGGDGRDVCPRGASIEYAGGPQNQDKISTRCT